jgi:hypothetical protein
VSNAVNGVSMQPDFVWIKARTAADNHGLFDSVRGVNNRLISNLTNAEVTLTDTLMSFNSNGFTLGVDAGGRVNASTENYVAWQWKAGGTAVSNTAGSITSSVSANTTAGFSVVTYTGTGANATVGHGLGVAPSMIIAKRRDSGATPWIIYHISMGAANYMAFDTGAQSSTTAWNSTTPTSTVFSVGANVSTNNSTSPQLAYCFAPVPGYSAFGSYTGNASADGPFVYLGFRPRYILIKKTDTSGNNWFVWDTSRDTYNPEQNYLWPNSSSAEGVDVALDALSNGFKIRVTSANYNGSGGTYIYACFAENPFKYANAR